MAYYDGPPGLTIDLIPPSPDGVDVVYDHPYADANPYVYVSNSPTNQVDPSGLFGIGDVINQIGGLLGVGRCCYFCFKYPVGSQFCICFDLCADFEAINCCEQGQRKTKGKFELCLTAGYSLCSSRNIGFFKQWEFRCSPKAKRGGRPPGPIIGGTFGSCPPSGCSGRICGYVTFGGYAFGSYGVQLCYTPENGTWLIDYGKGVGPPGTGAGGGGCATCVRP